VEFDDFVAPADLSRKVGTGVERCVRCNRRVKAGREYYFRHGLVIGLDCNPHVLAVETTLGRRPKESEDDFWVRVGETAARKYRKKQAHATKLGMAAKDLRKKKAAEASAEDAPPPP
jgi:hypothetical protein